VKRRKQKLAAEIGTFVRQYARKAHPGIDPNDRRYSCKIEAMVKRMRPEALDELLNGEVDDDSLRSPRDCQ
jgi:hypothetical protein